MTESSFLKALKTTLEFLVHPRFFVPLWVASGIILLVPEWIDPNGESAELLPVVRVVFVLSSAFVLVRALASIWSKLSSGFKRARLRGDTLVGLENLDPHEVAVLREFMFQRNKVIRVPLQDPVAAALMESGILEQAPGSPDQTILGWIVPVRLSTFAASKVDLAMLGFPEGDPTPEQLGAFAKYRPSFVKVIREHDQLRTGDWF